MQAHIVNSPVWIELRTYGPPITTSISWQGESLGLSVQTRFEFEMQFPEGTFMKLHGYLSDSTTNVKPFEQRIDNVHTAVRADWLEEQGYAEAADVLRRFDDLYLR